VLFVQIHDIRHIDLASARAEADLKIRARYDIHLHKSKLPNLYAISAFGNMVRFYCGNKATGKILPLYVPFPSDRAIPPDHLQDDWSVDILSHTGLRKMRRIV
ncbi:hypothetical protein C8Q76DRAFT_591888, partial [Earliella scabrosa]